MREERAGARERLKGIEGFASFGERTSRVEGNLKNALPSKKYGRCNSYFDYHPSEGHDFVSLGKKSNLADEIREENKVHKKNKESNLLMQENTSDFIDGFEIENDHPFVDQERFTGASLL